MDARSRNYENDSHNNNNKMLLDLIQFSKEERGLELRLDPPGDEQDWSHHHNENNNKRERNDDSSSLCFGHLSSHKIHHHQLNQHKDKAKDSSSFLELKSSTQNMHREEEKKQFSPSSANDAAVPKSSQKRSSAAGPVVGWPPIGLFRKNNNITSTGSSSKHKPQHNNLLHQGPNNNKDNNREHVHNNNIQIINKGLFVKINMDGVPIGRKIDINSCGSYQKLSSAVYDLFRGLFKERDSSGGGIQKEEEEEKVIRGLLDHRNGEYTLSFQDHQGHYMLVGDVPWNMFVSTVKRLRVLKSSDLSAISLGSKQKAHTSLDKAMK